MGQDLRNWNIEDESYWASTGKAIATRNLWISIPSLLCGFAVWLYWGILTGSHSPLPPIPPAGTR